jgi:hypothetical protein
MSVVQVRNRRITPLTIALTLFVAIDVVLAVPVGFFYAAGDSLGEQSSGFFVRIVFWSTHFGLAFAAIGTPILLAACIFLSMRISPPASLWRAVRLAFATGAGCFTVAFVLQLLFPRSGARVKDATESAAAALDALFNSQWWVWAPLLFAVVVAMVVRARKAKAIG